MTNVLKFQTPVSNVATLSSSALLVNLTISQWSGFKYDKKVSAEIDRDNSTTTKVMRANKSLLAGDSALADIRTVGNMLRTYHNSCTSPWSDTGPRLLPTALFFQYKQEMSKLEQQYSQKINEFLNEYPFKITQARYALGDLFNPGDYPSVHDIQSRFSIDISYFPLPESNDFRLDIGKQGLQELKDQYDALYNESINKAMTSCWDRLFEQLTKLSFGLRNENGEKGKIFDSVLENAVSLCDLLVPLNINNDTQLDCMRIELQNALYGVTTEDLRKSDYSRAVLKNAVDDLLGKF